MFSSPAVDASFATGQLYGASRMADTVGASQGN
jgi:hypothetical protein